MALQLDRGGFVGLTDGYRRALDAALRTAGSSSLGWVADARARRAFLFTLLKSELSPIEDRGVVFGLVTRAAGLDAAVHRRTRSSRSRSSTRRFPRRPRTRRSRASRRWSTATRCCASSRGRSAARSSSRSPTSCGPSSRRFPARSRSRSTRRRSASRSARTPIEFVIMSQVPYAELQRIVDRFLDEARKIPGVQNLQIDLRLNKPEVRVNINRDKLSRRRRRRRHRRPHAGDDAGRAPGHALQARRRAVRRDRAGRAARPHDAGGHQRHLRARRATASMVQLATWST